MQSVTVYFLILVMLYLTHRLGFMPFCPFCFLKIQFGRFVAVRYFRWLEKKLDEMEPSTAEEETYQAAMRSQIEKQKDQLFAKLGLK